MRRERLFLAVDGGNSKTDVVLGTSAGRVLARARGGPFRPQVTGLAAAVEVVAGLVAEVGLAVGLAAPVDQLSAFVAGADFPAEETEIGAALAARGWAERVHAANDTFALLHAGAPSGWGVAVVCGTGINCVGLGPDGSVARFAALGRVSGDWGGGGDLGQAVMFHAARAEDGRGPATALAASVVEHFRSRFAPALTGIATVAGVVEALHFGWVPAASTHGLTRPLFDAAAAGDEVARSLLDRQAREVSAMGLAALRRLGLDGRPCDVVLGGGVLAAGSAYLDRRVAEAFAAGAPLASLVTVDLPPVVGAGLHALGQLGLDHSRFAAARKLLLAGFATMGCRTPTSRTDSTPASAPR